MAGAGCSDTEVRIAVGPEPDAFPTITIAHTVYSKKQVNFQNCVDFCVITVATHRTLQDILR